MERSLVLSAGLSPAALGLLGLVAGAALNRLVERLPARMERDWWRELAAQLADADAWPRVLGIAPAAAGAGLARDISAALARPAPPPSSRRRSRLRGVALAAGLGALFAAASWRFGAAPFTLAWCAVLALLVAMAVIDWETRLLPDSMTLSLLWGGLACAALGWSITPANAILGAAAGYLVLWGTAWPFRLATGQEGMADGDFKLLAALGAWLGWQAVLPVVLMACVAGAMVGVGARLRGRLAAGQPLAFGPFLAAAGLVTIFGGPGRLATWIGLH